MDLKYDSHQNVNLNQHNGDPKGDEEATDPDHGVLLNFRVHVHRHEPVIDDHLAEQGD